MCADPDPVRSESLKALHYFFPGGPLAPGGIEVGVSGVHPQPCDVLGDDQVHGALNLHGGGGEEQH